ncbi:hypothetical protein [Undibacterium sp.]|uniref:hypothetical protein n=1 Tax=Undibacterium sp. TaxID=1914977 RepID=UPI003751F788
MKHNTKTNLVISFIVMSFAFSANSSAQNIDVSNTQSVTITAKRLSAEEKHRYDQEQANHSVQKVIISAKRLSQDEKAAFDKSVSK